MQAYALSGISPAATSLFRWTEAGLKVLHEAIFAMQNIALLNNEISECPVQMRRIYAGLSLLPARQQKERYCESESTFSGENVSCPAQGRIQLSRLATVPI